MDSFFTVPVLGISLVFKFKSKGGGSHNASKSTASIKKKCCDCVLLTGEGFALVIDGRTGGTGGGVFGEAGGEFFR